LTSDPTQANGAVGSRPPRIRILVATHDGVDEAWEDWQAARQASPHAARMAIQRIFRSADVRRGAEVSDLYAVGLGYGAALHWFGPVDDAFKRRLTIDYAGAVLDAGGFAPAGPAPAALVRDAESTARGASAADTAPMEGLVLLSHAETDLLALERARAELPAGFPHVVGHSLLGLSAPDALPALFGKRRSPRLLAIVRIHGTVA
jgi:hypothetical protein